MNILKQLVSKDTWIRVWELNKFKYKKEDREKFRRNVEVADILPIIITVVILFVFISLMSMHR